MTSSRDLQELLQFAPGQRWISDTEPDLGLGMVIDVDHRTVTLDFSAVDESRRYARNAAPLSRLVLNVGDPLQLDDVTAEITRLEATDKGTLLYEIRMADGQLRALPEALLPDTLSMNRPLDRLMSGQFDPAHWFQLKQTSLQLLGQAEASGLMGLSSARAELIPHQLYIADEVARRYAPRVMLADEVGLGKTIEAGLILQQQLVSGLSRRVLIIVPEPLLHQWLVEMLRRFNLHFTVLDAERCEAIQQEGDDPEAEQADPAREQVNPFTTTQLALCPISLFTGKPDLIALAEAAGWDLCIVDEAHHVQLGAEQEADPAYLALSRLAAASKGLLLLTATPEQLGHKNHFALLRLLDPARFNNYQTFVIEQSQYQDVASKIKDLEKDNEQVRELLDQHGTGRILFRNTRRGLSGFPQRRLQPWPLTAEADAADDNEDSLSADPRMQWLVRWLAENHDGKILLICAHDAMAIALEKHLRLRVGIRSSVFHRHMSLLERDRAAAYFAAQDTDAARILVCSEIGSEGRNFQFCRHLVLFDLPGNPDLLEQRIGRLDRIGQRHDINIHVPYVVGTRQESLFRWYHEALGAFETVSPAAFRVYQQFQHELTQQLENAENNGATFNEFLERVAARNLELQRELERGRDKLLERNSFNPERAAELVSRIQAFESDCSPQSWLLDVLDSYSVFYDSNSDGSVSIVPGEDMLLPVFPGLPDEGFEACFQRREALSREDRVFLSWQHPMVIGAMDLIIDSHQGKAAASVFSTEHGHAWPAPYSPLMLQCLFRIRVSAPAHLQMAKYLPATAFTLNLALNNRDDAAELNLDDISDALRFPDKSAAREQLQEHQKTLQKLLVHANSVAAKHCQRAVDAASKTMLAAQTAEIKRLLALKQNNPNIRQDEIDYLKEQTLALHQCLGKAEAELVAIHLILNPKQETI